MTYLLDSEINNATHYIPIAMQFVFIVLFIGGMIGMSALVGPNRKTTDKLDTFTSGIASHGDARHPMAIKYFLVAILFVLFDVEVIFFYPYAIHFRALGWSGFEAILLFVVLFLIGYFYIIKKRALQWED